MSAAALSGKSQRGVRGASRLASTLYLVVALLAIAAAITLPLSAYSLNLLMQATTYALAVLGLTIVLGYTGQINLAQAAFFGLGAYSVALGTTQFHPSANEPFGSKVTTDGPNFLAAEGLHAQRSEYCRRATGRSALSLITNRSRSLPARAVPIA
jgi:hypothetical protein